MFLHTSLFYCAYYLFVANLLFIGLKNINTKLFLAFPVLHLVNGVHLMKLSHFLFPNWIHSHQNFRKLYRSKIEIRQEMLTYKIVFCMRWRMTRCLQLKNANLTVTLLLSPFCNALSNGKYWDSPWTRICTSRVTRLFSLEMGTLNFFKITFYVF